MIVENTGNAIKVYGSSSAAIIVNNTIVDNSGSGALVDYSASSQTVNNVFAENGNQDIYEDDTSSDPTTVSYNLFFHSNPSGHFYYYDEGQAKYRSVPNINDLIPEAGDNLEGDPRFVDATNDDYHLRSDSSANTATPTPTATATATPTPTVTGTPGPCDQATPLTPGGRS